MKKQMNKKGISLIVLVITVIVMIVLAAAIIISVGRGLNIERAYKAVFKDDIRNIDDEMKMYIIDRMTYVDPGRDDMEEGFDYDTAYDPASITVRGEAMVQMFESARNYKDKIVIIDSRIYYIEDKLTIFELRAAKEMNLPAYEGE